MASAPEKGRKNTAQKQLPSWLRPAVPTIRKLLKNGALIQRGIPLNHALRLYSFIMLCAFIHLSGDSNNHWCTYLSLSSSVLYMQMQQKSIRNNINCCCRRNRKRIAAFVKIAILFCLWTTKKILSAFLRMNSNLYINHGESHVYHQDAVLHIINSAEIVYHHCESVIQPAADEIHALRDDMRLAAMIYHCFGNG